MTLTFQNSHIFTYSIRCLLLLTFRSVAAIVSEKSNVFTFSYRKAKVTKFDLAVKRSRSHHGHLMGRSPRCCIPTFLEIRPPVPEKIFEGFLPYMGMVAILVV